MNKNILRRIFAVIGLVGAVGTAVFITLYFFFMFDENYSGVLGTVAVAFVCVTAVFFILAYILKPRGETELGKPDDADASGSADGETETDDDDVEGDHNIVPDGDGNEERKDEQD